MGCSRAHAHKNIEHIKHEYIVYRENIILLSADNTTEQRDLNRLKILLFFGKR